MNDGNVNNNNKTNNNYVWPVRGGEWNPALPHLFSFYNLYRNYIKCRRNKRGTINALRFEVNAEENLFRLSEELQRGSYKPSRSICFVVDRPKMREIIAADFRDRVVHHLLVEQLEKIYEPVFIHDSYACRVEKGIHRAVGRVKDFIRQGSANGKKRLYYMHLDIRNFFINIDRSVLYGMIEAKVRKVCKYPPQVDALLWLTHLIIHNNPVLNCILKGRTDLVAHLPAHKSLFHAPQGKGLPVGNLTSQFFANVYLNRLDQFAKHVIKCRYYVRYCDDFLILDESMERLEQIRGQLKEFIEKELLLSLNPKHGHVTPVSNGIDFLGYIIRNDYTLVRRRVVHNLKARLNWLEKRLVDIHPDSSPSIGGQCREERAAIIKYDRPLVEQLQAVLGSYWGHLKWADTFKLRAALLLRYGFLNEFMTEVVSHPVFTSRFRREFPDVKSQYRYYAARFKSSAVFFQVGSFYEIYDNAAWVRQLGLRPISGSRRGALFGFPVKLERGYREKLLSAEKPVVVVHETGIYYGRLKERVPVRKYLCAVTL